MRYERRATIVIGPGGAGKSTLMEPLARNRHAAIIDADEAEKVLPEFHNGLGASAVHGESSELMYGPGGPMDRLSAQGANLVIQKIGHDPESIRKLVRGLRDRGYEDLGLVHLKVEPAEAFRRRMGRFLRTGRINAKGYRESAANPMNDIDADYASDKATDQTFAQDNAPAQLPPFPSNDEVYRGALEDLKRDYPDVPEEELRKLSRSVMFSHRVGRSKGT